VSFAPPPPERVAALACGEKMYFTGKPCKRGHVAPRRVDSYSCSECLRERTEAWAKKNPNRAKEIDHAWKRKNAGRLAQRHAAYAEKNRDALRAYNKAWASRNSERVRNANRKRRARLNGGVLSANIEMVLRELQRGRCAVCCRRLGGNTHLDHIMPLALGGTNTDTNAQLLCRSCNQRKHAKHPVQFMQEQGYLL